LDLSFKRLPEDTDIILSVNFTTFLILWHANELSEALQYANKTRKMVKAVIKKEVAKTEACPLSDFNLPSQTSFKPTK